MAFLSEDEKKHTFPFLLIVMISQNAYYYKIKSKKVTKKNTDNLSFIVKKLTFVDLLRLLLYNSNIVLYIVTIIAHRSAKKEQQ